MDIFRGGLKYLWISAIYRQVWSLTLMNTGGRPYKSLEKWFSLLTSGSHVDCFFFVLFFYFKRSTLQISSILCFGN